MNIPASLRASATLPVQCSHAVAAADCAPIDRFTPSGASDSPPLMTRQALRQVVGPAPPNPLIEHMLKPAKIKGSTIHYGHLEQDFLKALTSRSGKTTSEPTELPGVQRQTYQLAKMDSQLKPILVDGQPAYGDPATKTTFGQGWTPERISQLHETVFSDVKPSGQTGQTSTAQVKIGNDYFVGKFNPDGTPEKFYLDSKPMAGPLTEKPAAALDSFRSGQGGQG